MWEASHILTSKLGFDLSQIDKIERWCDRLMEKEVWQQTQPNDKQVEIFKQTVQKLIQLEGENQIVHKIKHS